MIDKVHFSALTSNPDKVRALLTKCNYDVISGQETYTTAATKNSSIPVISLTGNCVKWRGSLHKAYNQRVRDCYENVTGYSHTNFLEQLEFLTDMLRLDVNTIRFTHVEVGFNLVLSRHSKDYISSAAYYRGNNGHRYMLSKTVKDGDWLSFKHKGRQFELVGYGKMRDSNLPKHAHSSSLDNILRVELRLKRGALYFPLSLDSLTDICQYELLTTALRKAVSQIEFLHLPWAISHFGNYNGGSSLKRLSHLLLWFVKGQEQELIHLIETTTSDKRKTNDLKQALRDVYGSRPADIPDVFVDSEILNCLDKEIAIYYGRAFIPNYFESTFSE